MTNSAARPARCISGPLWTHKILTNALQVQVAKHFAERNWRKKLEKGLAGKLAEAISNGADDVQVPDHLGPLLTLAERQWLRVTLHGQISGREALLPVWQNLKVSSRASTTSAYLPVHIISRPGTCTVPASSAPRQIGWASAT